MAPRLYEVEIITLTVPECGEDSIESLQFEEGLHLGRFWVHLPC